MRSKGELVKLAKTLKDRLVSISCSTPLLYVEAISVLCSDSGDYFPEDLTNAEQDILAQSIYIDIKLDTKYIDFALKEIEEEEGE